MGTCDWYKIGNRLLAQRSTREKRTALELLSTYLRSLSSDADQ